MQLYNKWNSFTGNLWNKQEMFVDFCKFVEKNLELSIIIRFIVF